MSAGNGITPLLKWAGGKRKQLPHIKPLWEQFQVRRLVEPFCGGLGIATGLAPERALLNDISPHVINLYQWVQRGLSIPFEMKDEQILTGEHIGEWWEPHYYGRRDRFNALILAGTVDTAEAAGLFYYLIRTCFNGLCRFSQGKGTFNTPHGSRKSPATYITDLSGYKDAFANWDFTCSDFEQVPIEDDDFIYADPPYDVEFTGYSKEGFRWSDQQRTAIWLAKHKGPVVLSNRPTTRIVELYRSLEFDLKFITAGSSMKAKGERPRVKEVIATRNIDIERSLMGSGTSTVDLYEPLKQSSTSRNIHGVDEMYPRDDGKGGVS